MILLAEHQSPFGPIKILKSKRTGSVLYCQGGANQSEADERGVSLASYIHAIYGLLQQGRSDDVLIIGCGGGTLATMLASGCRRVTVVDVNPDSFFLARRYFGMPESVECNICDGREFLLSSPRIYDAIVVDAFESDQIPSHLTSLASFRLCRSRLAQHGLLIVNIHVPDDLDPMPDETCAKMAEVWRDVRLLDRPGYSDRNAIAIAGAVSSLKCPRLLVHPQTSADTIESELGTMQFRPWRKRCA